MHDIKWIRDNPDAFDAAMVARGDQPAAARLIALDAERRKVMTEHQEMLARRKTVSQAIGAAKKAGREAEAQDLMAEVAALKQSLSEAETREKRLNGALNDALASLPNLLADDVPAGDSEADNLEVRRWGAPGSFEVPPREHWQLGEAMGLMDFDTAAKLSGSRFVVLRGALARLERALGQFMIDLHTTEHGYDEVLTPTLVRADALYGTSQLPKFREDVFATDHDLYLIPTAEVTLTNLAADEILEDTALPIRVAGLTQCFRSEAGSAGRDTRGMMRQHQFGKVEMVSIVHPDHSDAELERKTRCAEEVLRRLQLPYRVVSLCAGDIGFGARKTYDIEVWLPGQERFREISSCSNCGDFQARRMKARFRHRGEKHTHLVHTLNGSGLAVGRTLIAVMENYQQPDGSIRVPEVLQPYLGGQTVIEAQGR